MLYGVCLGWFFTDCIMGFITIKLITTWVRIFFELFSKHPGHANPRIGIIWNWDVATFLHDLCLPITPNPAPRNFTPGAWREYTSLIEIQIHRKWGQLYMGVSKNRGTPKSSHCNRVFHYKPSILGYHYCWKHPHIYIYIWLTGPPKAHTVPTKHQTHLSFSVLLGCQVPFEPMETIWRVSKAQKMWDISVITAIYIYNFITRKNQGIEQWVPHGIHRDPFNHHHQTQLSATSIRATSIRPPYKIVPAARSKILSSLTGICLGRSWTWPRGGVDPTDPTDPKKNATDERKTHWESIANLHLL